MHSLPEADHSQRSSLLTRRVPLSDSRTDSVTRGVIEEGNRSPLHCGHYASCMPSQEEEGQNKTPDYEPWRKKYYGGVQGHGRSWAKIDESNVVFSTG